MALETLFETPPPLVSCENKESLNEGSERNPEEDGEILEDGELSDDVGGVQQTDEMGNEEEGYMDGGGGNYGYENDAGVEEEMEEQEQVFETPRKSRRRHRHREHKEEGDDEEEEEEGNEEGEDDRERRRRRKRRKEKHSSRRHHHKKSKRRKRHHSSEEENGSPEDVDADGARAPSKKRRSVHRERRHPSEQDEEEDWHGEMDGPDDEGRMERARGRRGQRRMSRGGDMWGMRGMEEQQEEQGYGSSGADSWEEEMRKYKAHQAGFVDEESEEEEMSPRMAGAQRGRGRGRGRGKPPPGAKHSFIQEKLKKIALAAKMKGKGRGRGSGPPGPKPPKEPVGEKKMMLHLICKFYLEGRCKKGENCTYSHDLTQQRKQELCKFYVSGFCNKGDTCLHCSHCPLSSEDEGTVHGDEEMQRGERSARRKGEVVEGSDMDLASDIDQDPWPEPGLPPWVPTKEDLEIEKRLWCWMTPDQLPDRPDLVEELGTAIGSWFRADPSNMYEDALEFAEYWVRHEMEKVEAQKEALGDSIEPGLGAWVPVQEPALEDIVDIDPKVIDPDRPGPGYHFYTTPGPEETVLRWAYLPKSALLHAPDVPSLTPNLRDFPCKYFHSGSECYQGEKCRFSHEPLNPHTKMLLEKSLSSFEEFQDGPPRSPSKTKGLLPTPGDTSHIPSLLDIDVQPPQLEEPPGPMSFYGADNPEYAEPSQQGPDQGDYQGQFQDQQGGPGPYSDQYQQQQQYPQDQDQYQDPYEMVNQFVSLARSNHDQAQNRDSTRQGQDQQDVDSNRGQETTPLPSSQSEDNSASSDKEISSSDFHPRERKTQLPSPPTDNSTKSPPQEEMEQSGQQDTSAPTSSSASRPVQGELSPEPSPPQGSPAGQKPEKQSIPASIPAKQKALFMRIQQKQHDGKTGSDVNSESDDNSKRKSSQDEALWYSSDEEERAKKKSSSAKKMNEPVITPKDSAEKTSDPGLPADTGLSSDAVKKLTAIQIPSALANLFAGKTTPTTPSSSGNQVTFNLLDFVKKGPAASKPAPLTPTSPQTEILDSPMSPVNEEFRLIECIREPGRPDPRSGREKRDKSDMRFRVLHWKDNKYSINDPDDRPSLQPIELTTPTELKGQPNFPKTTLSQFMPGNQMAQPSMTVPPSQGPIDPRMKRDPRLARMQGLEEAAGPKDPRMNRDPRSMASNVPNMPDMGINNMPPPLLPMPDERMRHMGPGPRPSPQDGLLPMPPGGPRPPLGPLPPFMPGPRGMLPPFGGPLPPMGRFPQDMPPPDMNMPPRGPPFQGPGPRMGPGPGHGQHPPFIRTPLIRQMSDGSGNVSGPPNFQGGPGPGDLPMNRFRGPSPNDPRGNVNDPRNINPRQAAPDPRQAAQDPRDQRQAAQDPRSQRQIAQDPRDPRQMAQDPRGQNQTVQDPRDPRQTVQGPRDPRQMAQDPRDPRQGLQESRDPRLAQTDSRDPRKGPPAESRDPRLMRQMSSNKPGGGSPSQSDNLPAQDIDERLNIPKLQDVDLRRQVPDRKAKLQGFSIPKLPKRCDVAEADTTSGDPDNLGGSGGISHRKVPSAHHGLPQGLSSFDVGGKTRTNFPSGDPRTNSGRDSPQMTLQIQIPGNGEGDGDMAAAIAQLAEEPDIQLKDMFKTQDPTASPFC
ncbi:zinc finger CCCH domain-containing protein 4-like isoform X1 [Lytechinus variegatus]|uniref:zinc finger CCCH domain-containing protein 4-like isoform X1 n=1 Tax=Lytechinus variegatus TaxID=7654 RepID=UPI001BB17B68|nr:zinc finger CCCH domain-containing protein 4-like isoform X1 [Lytechinus variegatus]